VRRLVALFVVALAGAVLYGLSGQSSGISVNHDGVSGSTLRSELAAISHNDSLDCFVTALNPTNYEPGAGGYSIKAKGAAAWANLRVEGLAINQYVTTTYRYVPNAAALANAKVLLENEMTEQAKTDSLDCPGTAADALAEMPSEMRTAEIQSEATSQYLVNKVKAAIPLTASAMKTFYNEHVSDYDTLCVSIALVPPADVSAFAKSQTAGLSVAQLAKKYSQDPSAAKGGAYGCFAPSSTSYSGVRAAVGTEGLDVFTTTPEYTDYNGTEYALYVAVTKRTVTPYAQAAQAVLSDLQTLNAAAASSEKNQLLEEAAVYVDPAFGRWGASKTGLAILATTAPHKSGVSGASQLAGAATTSYK
jgi:hypothetical protein